jgi:hypothetical protein
MSVIPLSCAHDPNAQLAVEEALKALRMSVHRFETAANQLLGQAGNDARTDEALCDYINVCKQMTMGNLHWR